MKHVKLFEDYPSFFDNDKPVKTTPFFGMHDKPTQTVFNIIAESNSHKILKLAIEAAGLKATLSDTREQFTIFAPNDEAFKMLASGTLGITTEELLVNVEKLKEVLLYHCVKGAISSGDLKNNQVIETLQGGEVEVEMIRGDLFINSNETGWHFTGAEVIGSDLVAANGVVHVIDAVLIPEVEENI